MEAKIDRPNKRVGGLKDGQQGLTAWVGNGAAGRDVSVVDRDLDAAIRAN
jgi:hypothetical protein